MKLVWKTEEKVDKIYREDVDLSGVPRVFFRFGRDGEGYYEFPQNDVEVLNMCERTQPLWNYFDRGERPETYEVKVEAEKCTVESCLELLKGIGRENRFTACSVECARLFFAELNKEDADKLKGLNGICSVLPRGQRVFHYHF